MRSFYIVLCTVFIMFSFTQSLCHAARKSQKHENFSVSILCQMLCTLACSQCERLREGIFSMKWRPVSPKCGFRSPSSARRLTQTRCSYGAGAMSFISKVSRIWQGISSSQTNRFGVKQKAGCRTRGFLSLNCGSISPMERSVSEHLQIQLTLTI